MAAKCAKGGSQFEYLFGACKLAQELDVVQVQDGAGPDKRAAADMTPYQPTFERSGDRRRGFECKK